MKKIEMKIIEQCKRLLANADDIEHARITISKYDVIELRDGKLHYYLKDCELIEIDTQAHKIWLCLHGYTTKQEQSRLNAFTQWLTQDADLFYDGRRIHKVCYSLVNVEKYGTIILFLYNGLEKTFYMNIPLTYLAM